MTWQTRAASLAESVTHTRSRWRPIVAATPRHQFVPCWWARDGRGDWTRHDGPADPAGWLDAAYADTSLVTRVGALHADQAKDGQEPAGVPTSSATLPSLVVRMLQHARLGDGDTLLDIGTGSGYGCALAARRLGDWQVTSIDVDPYLVDVARQRLAAAGVRPEVLAVDATGPLPGSYDRIVATVAVPSVPAAWLAALRPGGRLVTTLAGTSLLVTADKVENGGAVGRVEWDRAGFMPTRHGEDYPPGVADLLSAAGSAEGDVTVARYPLVDVDEAWDLSSMLELTAPGIARRYETASGRAVLLMAHADGSWARATADDGELPTVHQGGPRRLWDILDEIRSYWLHHGELPVRGAFVRVKPDGTTILRRGSWRAALPPAP